MALCTHFTQSEIGCPGIAEFTVQRTEALFDHITGLRQISVAFGLRFRQRTVAVGFAHNAVQQLMFFQMLPVFRTVIAFVGIDGRTFGNAFQQRRQVVALMGIGGGDVQFLNIAFLIGTVLGEFCKGLSLSGLKSLNKRRTQQVRPLYYDFRCFLWNLRS